LCTVIAAYFVRGTSPAKAWRIGLSQHSLAPGFNSGWSEAAFAGAIQKRIAGPIWRNGIQVSDIWLGSSEDPPASNPEDMHRAIRLSIACVIIFVLSSVPLWAL